MVFIGLCRAFKRNLAKMPVTNPAFPPVDIPPVIEASSTPAVFNTPPIIPPAAEPPMVDFPITSRELGIFSRSLGPV